MGYLLKEAPHATIIRAIDRVRRQSSSIPASQPGCRAIGRAADRPRAGDPPAPGRGLSNADVAQSLFISQETVKSHVRHILAKLEADTRTQAVAIALRESIIA